MGDLADEIRGYAALTPGWDSYGAPAITPLAIEVALKVLEVIEAEETPERVVPAVDGGVGFNFNRHPNMLIVEVENDGEIWGTWSTPEPYSTRSLVLYLEHVGDFVKGRFPYDER